MMGEAIQERKTCDVTFFNVDYDDAVEFRRLMGKYAGNSGKILFTELLQRYNLADMVASLSREITELRTEVEELKGKET